MDSEAYDSCRHQHISSPPAPAFLMTFDFPLETLYPPYLNFALGAALRQYTYRISSYWLTTGREDDTDQAGSRYFDLITNGVLQLDNTLENLSRLPLGDLGRAQSSIARLRESIRRCSSEIETRWNSRQHLTLLEQLRQHDENDFFEYLASEDVFRDTDFPIDAIRDVRQSRSMFADSQLSQYRACFSLGSLLSGVFHNWVMDDDYPSHEGLELLQCSFADHISSNLWEAQPCESSLAEIDVNLVASNDKSFWERVGRLMRSIKSTLKRTARRLNRLRPSHLNFRITPGRLAYELLLDMQVNHQTILNRYVARFILERDRRNPGFEDEPVERIQSIKYQANQFLKDNPYLPAYPCRDRSRQRR